MQYMSYCVWQRLGEADARKSAGLWKISVLREEKESARGYREALGDKDGSQSLKTKVMGFECKCPP